MININLNTGKFNLLIFNHKHKHQWAKIGKYMVLEENKVKPLGTTVQIDLILDSNILNI